MFVTHLLTGENNYIIDNNDPNDISTKLISPTVDLEENKFGSFKFEVPKIHSKYNDIFDDHDAEIEIYYATIQNGSVVEETDPMFRGRMLEVQRKANLNRIMIFEGELAYLQDTVQEPASYENVEPKTYVQGLLKCHNKKVPAKKQFQLGIVTVTDDHTTDKITGIVNRGSYTTNYTQTTWSCLSSLQSSLGGYFQVRYADGKRYLDYLKDHEINADQPINFGQNLVDFAEEWSLSELYTVIIPLGADVTTTDNAGNSKTAATTIASVNGTGGVYLSAEQSVIDQYGRREKAVEFKGIQDPNKLKKIAQLYLTNTQFDNMVLSLTAVDLVELGYTNYHNLRLHRNVTVNADPYGLHEKKFPLTKITIPLKDPGRAVYTMTATTKPVKSMSTAITDHNKNVDDSLSSLNDKIDDKKSTEELAADGEIGIGNWIFGVPELLYYADEQKSALLYISNSLFRAWDAMATSKLNRIIYEEKEVAGSKTQMPTSFGESTIDSQTSATKSNSYKMAIDNAYNYDYRTPGGSIGIEAVASEYAIQMNPTALGHINIDGKNGDCLAFYMVIKMTAGANNTMIHFNRSGNNDFILCQDSSGALCTTSSPDSPKAALYLENDDVSSQTVDVTDSYLVIALLSGISPGRVHTTSRDMLVGAPVGTDYAILRPTSTTNYISAALDYKLNLNYALDSGVETQNPDYDHQFQFVRFVECRGVAGVINMDEVYDNMNWLVGRFITHTIPSDDSPLPTNLRSI